MHPQSIIYRLDDPRDGLVRYVGMTRVPLIVRLAAHVTEAYRGMASACDWWVYDLLLADLMPQIREITRVAHAQARDAERYWIQWYAHHDAPILNKHGNPCATPKLYGRKTRVRAKPWQDIGPRPPTRPYRAQT